VAKTSNNASRSKRNSTLSAHGGTTYKYVKHQKLLLKTHPDFIEKWVQERIAEDPSILGMGEPILKDKERNQPGAGRMDLLLQDPDSNLRYEVEIQLGKTDECHIFRTIEYWDLEKKRYPQYDHVAVLIAEDMTSRFLNIISLLNGLIPLVAIQLNVIQVGNQITLLFTIVLDHRLGLAPEEEEEQEVTERAYWEKRSSKLTVTIADEMLQLRFINFGPQGAFEFVIGIFSTGEVGVTDNEAFFVVVGIDEPAKQCHRWNWTGFRLWLDRTRRVP
jgi:hypothetical protein